MEKHGWFIAGLGVLVLGLAYIGSKYYYPPDMGFMALNPLDGTGSFQFGRASGANGPGTVDGGWGWTATFASFAPGTGWTILIMHNGTIYKTVTINTVGVTSI